MGQQEDKKQQNTTGRTTWRACPTRYQVILENHSSKQHEGGEKDQKKKKKQMKIRKQTRNPDELKNMKHSNKVVLIMAVY